MSVVLIAIGGVDREIIETLKNGVSRVFKRHVRIGNEMPEPSYALCRKRGQYLSTAILNALMEHQQHGGSERMLGIVDHDLYVPELNFVFGEADMGAAVISLTRLRQEFYGLPEDRSLFHRRALTEAVHELGHTYGLGHCCDPRCVMFFSNSMKDTDAKDFEFCRGCRDKLR